MTRIYVFLISTGLLLLACKKTEQTFMPLRIITVEPSMCIYDILKLNDSTLLLAGGQRNSKGKIYISNDKGDTWTKTWESSHCIYTLYLKNDTTIFAGGDSVTILKSSDKGQSWELMVNYDFAEWQKFVTPIQGINFLDDNFGIATGGDNHSKGIVCITDNGGNDWQFKNFNNEFHAITFDDDKNAYIFGYGKILKTTDYGKNWTENFFTGDNLQDVIIQNKTIWTCGYKGNIYNNKTGKWQYVFKVSDWNSSIHWRNMVLLSRNSIVAVGNRGLVWHQSTNKLSKIQDVPDLLSVVEIENNLYAGTSSGTIIVFSY